jgi:GntP family gluconate:H+ symporter
MIEGASLILVFGLSICFVLVSIIRFKVNPFLALILTTVLTGFAVNMPVTIIVDSIATGFGNTLKGIGLVIGLGIILGRMLSESGATQQIASFIIRKFGQRNAPLAITVTGFLVSIPVFFDAAFIILVSLVRNVSRISKIPIITLTTSLAIGLIASHNMVIPTPGPVEVGNIFNVSMGIYVLFAILISVPAILVGGWAYGLFLGKIDPEIESSINQEKGTDVVKLPSVGLSLFVLLLPILLILTGSIVTMFIQKGAGGYGFFEFIGNKNIALFISAFVSIGLLARYITTDVNKAISDAAGSAGMILLITGAGGSFGYVINQSGIGNYLVTILTEWNISFLVMGFVLGAILRGALGSSTVALVTAAAILGPLIPHEGLQPVFIALSICAGGMCMSFPNDSGFWVVSRFANLTVSQTLRSWTLGSSLAGLTAFLLLLVLDKLF